MKKNRRIILAAVPLAIVAAFALIALIGQRAPPEPVYQGKTLTKWLEVYDAGNTNSSIRSIQDTEYAIQEMGTNAIPTLLRMLESHDSKLKLWAVSLARRQHVFEVNFVPETNKYRRAAMGLEALGPRTESALPHLIRIYDHNPSPLAHAEIARILSLTGPPAKAAVPSLLRDALSADNSNYVRSDAIFTLGHIHAEPERVVPVLIKALGDTNRDVQFGAAFSLGEFGPDAKAAVPALVKFLESNGPPPQPAAGWTTGISYYYQISVDSLRKIDPEAAAKFATNNASIEK